MKKTEKININGFVFFIDEDAYVLLNKYMESIESHFSKQEGGKEIIDDIESRIAEIFQSKISKHKEVITINDVKKAIETLGNPEDFEGVNENEEGQSEDYTGNRRLYRDPENSVIAGIASGIAHYVSVDPAWVRAAFLLLILFNGFGVILYLILWVVVPRATTHAQRIEMKGRSVNIENIEKSVKNEFKNVKDNFRKYKDSEGYNRIADNIVQIFEVIGKIFLAFIKVILIIIAVVFIITGFSIIAGLFGLFVFKEWAFFDISVFKNWHSFIYSFPDFIELNENMIFVSLGLLFLIIIPLLSLIYWIIKRMFNLKIHDRPLGVTVFVFWILCLLMVIVMFIHDGTRITNEEDTTESIILKDNDYDSIFIDARCVNNLMDDDEYPQDFLFDNALLIKNGEKYVYGRPKLKIVKSLRDNVELTIIKKSLGKTFGIPDANLEKIDYSWFQDDSLLVLDRYFYVEEGEKWYMTEVNLTLEVPEHKIIVTSEKTKRILKIRKNHSEWQE